MPLIRDAIVKKLGKGSLPAPVDLVQRVGQGHLAVAVVVAVLPASLVSINVDWQ